MRLSSWSAPIEQISASSIAMLVACPEQFRLRKIKKMPETMGVDRFIGIIDHATHAENFSQKIHTKTDLSPGNMDSIYLNAWDETIMEEGEPAWDSPVEDTRDLGIRMTQIYHEVASPYIQPIKVEQRFEEKLKGLPIPVVGYIDVETRDRLIERKTTSTKLSKPKAKWVVQGRIYSLFTGKPVEYSIITKQKTPQVVTVADAPGLFMAPDHNDSTRTVIEQALAMLNDYWVRYGPDTPWPTNGIYHDWLCGYCSFGPKYGNNCVAWNRGAHVA